MYRSETAAMTQFTVACRGGLLPFLRMQILQITDPHLYGSAGGALRGVETDSSLRNVLDDALRASRTSRRCW